MITRGLVPSRGRATTALAHQLLPPEQPLQSTSDGALSQRHVLQLQATAGNAAVVGLLAQRARPRPLPSLSRSATPPVVARKPGPSTGTRTDPTPATTFPWVGKVQTRYNAALRRDPSKDPNTPYANITADLPTGAMVEVTGVEKGWLKVEVINPAGRGPQKGYVSHELIRFIRGGAWEIEMPPDPVPRLAFSVTEAFLVLKRAETKRASDPRYAPTDDETRRIEVATKSLEDTKRYRVDPSTFRVTFAQTAGTKIKIESIEDFVLFAETVERQYPKATPTEVASEIRQVFRRRQVGDAARQPRYRAREHRGSEGPDRRDV